jgi:lysylphosphatidylglycerol synthetase-like protein (DUF2156 family)
MSFLRREYNLAKREELTVKEIFEGEINLNILNKISNEWISNATSTKTEMTFLTKPFEVNRLFKDYKRVFVVKNKEKLIGFIELEPIFKNNKIIGFYADIIRTINNMPAGAVNYLILNSMNQIFLEGYEVFSMGLAPFNKSMPVYNNNLRIDNKIATLMAKLLFNYGNSLYPAKGQAFHKERFGVPPIKSFFCSKKYFPFLDILGAFKVCNINFFKK